MKNTCAVILAWGLLATPALADKKLDDAIAKAEDQLQKGKPEEALKTMQKAVSDAPEAQLAMARFQQRLGNLDDAAAAMAKATQAAAAAPPALQSQILAAQAAFDLQRGTGKDALAHAEAAAKAEASAGALAVLARAQARVGDAATGLATADKAVQASATSGEAHAARGEALLALHRNDDALAAYRKALEVDPKQNRARVGVAAALMATGKATEAVAEAHKATEVDPKSAEAFAMNGLALIAENKDNWGKAIAEAQQGAFLDEKNPLVQMAVGQIFELNNLKQAVEAYKKAIATDPGFIPAQLALVTAQERNGDIPGALAAAQKLVQDLPKSGEAQLRLGRLYLRKNDFTSALPALEKATQLSPNLGEAWGLLGTTYAQLPGKAELAVAAYKKATDLEPGNLDYRTTYGLLLGINKQFDAGIAELKKVVATPGYKEPDGWINLGWVYRNAEPKRTPESIAAYKKALELDPKAVAAALGLGWSYTYAKDWDNSIAAFKKALELDPTTGGEVYNGIAWCYFFKKDIASAKSHAEKAKAGGRNVDSLLQNIDRYEKALARSKEEAERELAQVKEPRDETVGIGSIAAGLRAKEPGARINACRALAQFRGAAVPLLTGVLTSEPEPKVREAAAKALGDIGPSAKDALPTMKYMLNSAKSMNVIANSADEMRREAEEEDYRRALKDAIAKIERK